ncbi:MAG TPA: GNAT family protein [Acidimicrobiales bacterium]|nr:GNAT family protein [Acidimicrobiales bacterium]
MAHPYWPLFDLVVRTPVLELRYPDDATFLELIEAYHSGVFDGDNQFLHDWVNVPSPQRERDSLKWWWSQRSAFSPEQWRLELAVFVDGRAVGMQSVDSSSFLKKRTVTSGSWLARPYQGRGLGKEMRTAILHLAFDGLGAVEAYSAAFASNAPSLGVSRSVGYLDNGTEISLRGEVAAEQVNFRMTRDRFAELRRDDIEIVGLEPCLEMLGLAPDFSVLQPKKGGDA